MIREAISGAAGLALGVLAGCTTTVELDPAPLDRIVALSVSPSTTELSITDLDTPRALDLVATGTFADGSKLDVTDLVAWTVDDPTPGGLDAPGHYVSTNAAVGHVVVHAAGGGFDASAQLVVRVNATLRVDPPPGADAVFAAPVAIDPARAPVVLYPAAGTLVPPNVAPLELQLASGAGNDAVRVTFDAELLHLDVLMGSERWRFEPRAWSLLESTHQELSVAIAAGTTTNPGALYGGPTTSLAFAREPVPQRLTYWSGGTNAVASAALDTGVATRMFSSTGGKCVGCHVASRDGTQLAFGYGGDTLRTVAADDLSPIITNDAPMGWATFSPEGDLLLVSDRGTLTLRDAATGAPVGPNGGEVPLPSGKKATHPDWSPDGRYVAVALAPAIAVNTEVVAAEIARIPYNDGTWGVPEILVPRVDQRDNNYFPRWSPDGRYLAYVHATGTSFRAASAELRLVPAAGGPSIALRAASRRVGLGERRGLGSTMPTWAPSVNGDVAWLAFASTRPCGYDPAQQQIWIAAVDLSVSSGGDPSFPAFRLPDHEPTLANNPIWLPDTSTR